MLTGCSCRVDAAIERAAERQKERDGVYARDRRVVAHASVLEDWTEHHDERPEDVRREVWVDPFFEPVNPTHPERRFVQTRRIRQRTLRWRGGQP
jgi:hypothetical protein